MKALEAAAWLVFLVIGAYLVIRIGWAAYVNFLASTMKPGLKHYRANMQSKRWQALRRYVIWRDARRCRVCHRAAPDGLDVHHILPISKGGSHFTSNLIAVHRQCHAALHGRKVW